MILGAVKGVQPIVGAMKSLIKRLSEPFEIMVEFLLAPAFAAVFCASTVPLISRYVVSTLSLWSISTTRKSLVTGHGCPVAMVAVPGGGTVRSPALTAASAAVNHSGPLQYANCPKTEPPSPLTQPFVSPANVIVLALDPNQIPTTAPDGIVGTTGVMKLTPATSSS